MITDSVLHTEPVITDYSPPVMSVNMQTVPTIIIIFGSSHRAGGVTSS